MCSGQVAKLLELFLDSVSINAVVESLTVEKVLKDLCLEVDVVGLVEDLDQFPGCLLSQILSQADTSEATLEDTSLTAAKTLRVLLSQCMRNQPMVTP